MSEHSTIPQRRHSGPRPGLGRQVLRGLVITAVLLAAFAFIGSLTYDDQLDRSRISEAIVAADACKESVGAFVENRKAFPSTAREAGCNEEATRYAEPVRISGSRIELPLRNINRSVDGTVLVLEPIGGVGGTTRNSSRGHDGGWRCGTNAGPKAYKYFPTHCRQVPLAR